MIKLLFLMHDLGHGGAEKVLVNLVNNLNREKFDITVIALFGGGVNEKNLKDDIRYKVIFSRTIRGNSRLMKLFSPEQLHRYVVKEYYDIEVSYLEGPSARIISGCKDKGTKLVSWVHVEQHSKEIAAKSFRSYEEAKACYERFDHTVCVSAAVRDDFQRLFPSINEVEVLYNTNETDAILEASRQKVMEASFQKEEFKICGVGKIVPTKGFDKLARIHKRLIEAGYQVHTYILGVGSDQEKIEKYIQKEKLEDTFTFLGYQTNPYKYVAKCDLFVCASTAEGFSTAATEALVVGTPVITTPVAGMREMLGENNEYGIITEQSEEALYQGIKALVESQERHRYYTKMAEIRGRDFSKEKTVRDVEKMLEDINIRY